MKTFKNLFFGFAAFALIVVLLSAAFPGFPTAKIFPFDMRIVGHLTVDSNLMVGDTITRMVIDDEINLQANTYLDDATLYHAINTIGNGDATPDVSAGNVWWYTTALTTVTVTDLDNPTPGALYIIVGGSDTQTLTINNGGNFYLTGNITLGANDVIVLFCMADNNYIEICRSSN